MPSPSKCLGLPLLAETRRPELDGPSPFFAGRLVLFLQKVGVLYCHVGIGNENGHYT